MTSVHTYGKIYDDKIFCEVFNMFTSILNSVMNEPSIAPFVATCKEYIASLGLAFPLIIVCLGLIVGLFGRRLSDPIRFLLLFAIGFAASVHWVAPLVQGFVPAIPGYAIGLALGIFAAVMSRFIYNMAYIGVIGYETYIICFNAAFLVELTAYTKGNLPVCITVAVVATVIALLLRKYLEMIITAAAGGVAIAYFAKQLFDYTVYINLDPRTALFLIGGVLAIPMFIYQYYNRVIY